MTHGISGVAGVGLLAQAAWFSAGSEAPRLIKMTQTKNEMTLMQLAGSLEDSCDLSCLQPALGVLSFETTEILGCHRVKALQK